MDKKQKAAIVGTGNGGMNQKQKKMPLIGGEAGVVQLLSSPKIVLGSHFPILR